MADQIKTPTIREQKSHGFTAWEVRDGDSELIARFDSRGGYTRADAQRVVDEVVGSPEERCMAHAEAMFEGERKTINGTT